MDAWVRRQSPAQLSGPEAVAQRLHARAGVARDGAPLQDAAAADALLLVSGSHALRPAFSWTGALQVSLGRSCSGEDGTGIQLAKSLRLGAKVNRSLSLLDVLDHRIIARLPRCHAKILLFDCMQDSTSALQIARSQREQGGLPNTLSLWAVSNPLRDSPDSVLRKVPALLSAPRTLVLLSATVHPSWRTAEYAEHPDLLHVPVLLGEIAWPVSPSPERRGHKTSSSAGRCPCCSGYSGCAG